MTNPALTRAHMLMNLAEHIEGIIKRREFTVSGDKSHISVRHILEQAENIDKPKKYKFQADDVNEADFINSIQRSIPLLGLLYDYTVEDYDAYIAGTKAITLTGESAQCYDCAKNLRITLDGKHIHLDCEDACENNGEFYVDIDFPTGVVVFADWPDRFSEIENEGYLPTRGEGCSVSFLKGQRQSSESYASQGILHLSVGNTCPSWYYNESTNAIVIGAEDYDEEKDEFVVPEGFKSMGRFCTDLWWVTMLDMSRYEELLSKVPEERNKEYYEKDVETATIKPGRYRFHTVPADDVNDDYARVFAKAQYLGPCDEIPKVKSVLDGRIMLTPHQLVVQQAKRYPTLYSGQTEEVRFSVMDHIFNVIGNGISSKGEFLSYISVPAGTEISDEMPPESEEKSKWDKDYVRAPYPNFKEQFSLVHRDVRLEDIPDEWLEEAIWFYAECRKFFDGPNANHYHGAYPHAKPRPWDAESWAKAMEERRVKTKTEEEFFALVTKDYECEFRGDLDDFLVRRWAKEKARITKFITETINMLLMELTRRSE